MSIGVIIFARVATQILQDSQFQTDQSSDVGSSADITVILNDNSLEYTAGDFDPILLNYTSSIKNFGMLSKRHYHQMLKQYDTYSELAMGDVYSEKATTPTVLYAV